MPSTVLGLVLFLCFITPGLVFELLRERSRPARQYSVLRETSVVIVASVSFLVPAVLMLLLARSCVSERRPDLESQWFPHFYAMAKEPAQYSASHLAQVVVFILAAIALAGLLACATDLALRRRYPSAGAVRKDPLLFDVLDGPFRPTDARAVIAAVELKNGAIVHGAILGHESKTDQTLAWLALTQHSQIEYAIRQPDGNLVKIPDHWEYILIPGDEVRTISAGFSAQDN
jgi:Family of unknown function (DUF6338)